MFFSLHLLAFIFHSCTYPNHDKYLKIVVNDPLSYHKSATNPMKFHIFLGSVAIFLGLPMIFLWSSYGFRGSLPPFFPVSVSVVSPVAAAKARIDRSAGIVAAIATEPGFAPQNVNGLSKNP
jgi:hypothetical protein